MALEEIVMSREDAARIDATNVRQLFYKFSDILRYREMLWEKYDRQEETEAALTEAEDYPVIAPIARYATNIAAGYFIGKPCKYYSRITQSAKYTELPNGGKRVSLLDREDVQPAERSEIETYLQVYRAVLRRNHEDAENMELARNALIHRVGYERIYTVKDPTDGHTDIRFKAIDPKKCVLIKDTSIERKPVAFICLEQFADPFTDDLVFRYEVITEGQHRFYEFGGANAVFGSIPRSYDSFNDKNLVREYDADEGTLRYEKVIGIPIIEYVMPENKGFYEDCLGLINARDALLNNMRNTFKYNDEAILMMIGYMKPSSDEEMGKLRDELERFKILFLGEDNKVQWLLKEVPIESIAGWYNILSQDIFAMLGIKNPVKQSEVYQNITTVRYQNYGMENTIIGMERQFEQSLLEGRAQMITKILNFINNTAWDWELLDVAFERNLPTSRTEEAQFIAQMKAANVLSDADILDQVSFVEDTDAAVLRKRMQDIEQARMSAKIMMESARSRFSDTANPYATLEEDVTNDRRLDNDDGRVRESRQEAREVS
jgi:SPP1 family phage portal protein